MKITEKTINRNGQTVDIVEFIPGGIERLLRWKSGFAGLLLIAIAIALTTFIAEFQGQYRIKTLIFGLLFGGGLIVSALSRRVYQSEDKLSIRSGLRFCGLNFWSLCIPMTGQERLEISRNRYGELVITVECEKNGDRLLSIGSFVDGNQAVRALSLLRPEKNDDQTHHVPSGSLSSSVIRELERGAPVFLRRLLILLIFSALCLLGWFDQSWVEASLSMIIGMIVLLVTLRSVTPSWAVIYSSDDGHSVRFWTRHRFFYRLEYEKSLVSSEPPSFLRKKIHWASVGWVLIVPIYLTLMVYLTER